MPTTALPVLDDPGFENDLPALRHGVPGVESEVEQDVLKLGRITLDNGRSRFIMTFDLNSPIDAVHENLGNLVDDLMQIHGSVFVGPLAGKGQQLAGEIRGVAGRRDDLPSVGRDGLLVDHSPHQ